MTTTVRNLTDNVSYTRTGGQFVETLSNGTAVALVKGDVNTLYLYYSPDRVTWTLKNTIALAQPRVSGGNVGMCVDPSDNVNVYYLADMATDELRYFRMAWAAGPAWTKSGEETITTETSSTVGAADICYGDISGARSLVFVWINDDGASARKISYKVRTTAGTWGTTINFTLPNVGGLPGDVAIVRDQAPAAANLQKFAIIGNTKSGLTHILVVEVNIATGAASSSTTIDASSLGSYTGAQRDVGVYCYANGQWTAVAIYGVGAATMAWAARFSTTAYLVQPTIKALGYVSDKGTIRARHVGYTNGRPWIAYEQELATGTQDTVYGCAAKQTAGAIQWGEQFAWMTVDEVISISSKCGRINDTQGKADLLVQTQANDGLMRHLYNTTPTVQSPAPNGINQVTNQPTLQAYISSLTPAYAEWDVARDVGFTTDKKTVVQQIEDFRTVGTVSEVIPLAQQLDQGTWYLRVLAESIFGNRSAYHATIATFDVVHPPTTINQTPKENTGLVWAATNRLQWEFSDTWPGDAQTAFQVILVRDSDDAAILNTGKVVSANQFYDAAIPSGNKGQFLRWTVAVWDTEDVQGPTSEGFVFVARSAPSVVVTAPITSTNQPTPNVAWTYTPSVEGGVQARWTVTITDDADSSVVYEATGADASTGHTVAGGGYLLNGHNYTFRVTVVDEWGLSATDTETSVDALWTPPAQPTNTVTTTSYNASGYVTVTWTNAVQSVDHIAWRVYRSAEPDLNAWELAYETTNDVLTTHTFNDYFTPEGVFVRYAVVQVTDVLGSAVESLKTSQTEIKVASGYYWLIDSTNTALNFALHSVVGDSFTEEQEVTEFNLINRGRKVERGTVWGYRGTLEVHLRGSPDGTLTARKQRQQIEEMKRTNRAAYLRNPFGDVWAVNMGDVAFARIPGVGTNEYSNLTIPYMEIS